MFSLISGLIGNVVGIAADHFRHKRALKEAQVTGAIQMETIKVTHAEKRATAGALHEIEWEQAMARGSINSWKDEWFALILSLPFLAAFFGYPEMAERAFNAISKAPEWYTMAFLVAVGASFGVRIWKHQGVKKLVANKPPG